MLLALHRSAAQRIEWVVSEGHRGRAGVEKQSRDLVGRGFGSIDEL
jgi:hypothetical protein